MYVAVRVLESGLVYVRVSVLSPVLVGVRVLVLNMLVLMSGVRMRVRRLAVLVFVRVRVLVSVLIWHRVHPLYGVYVRLTDDFSATTRNRSSARWCRGTPGPACSALKTASMTNWRT